MVTDKAVKSVSCPVCKAPEKEPCVDSSGITVPLHVARRRRYRIINHIK